MPRFKWTLIGAVIAACAVWVALQRCDTDQPPENTAAIFIQRAAFREATPQTGTAPATASRGMTAMEFQRLCAVNCFYFLNRLHGVRSTYEDVKAALQPGGVGVSMGHLSEVAKAYGYGVTPVKLSRSEMFTIADPMIVLAFPAEGPQAVGHFGLVVPVPSRKGYWVFDPPRERMWVSQDQMKEEDNRQVPVLLLKPPRTQSVGYAPP